MKRVFTIFTAVLLTVSMWAQNPPQKMSYQAVIRDASNHLVTTQIGIQISILQGTFDGTIVYSETQTPTPNINGLVTIEIGDGNPSAFASIDWSNGPYFLKTETDPSGGTNYNITGSSQLLSVPYALYAKTVADYSETDPVFVAWNKSTGISITASQVTDFQTSVTDNAEVLANTAKNSYPTDDQTKLAGIAPGANVGVVPNTPITGATKTKITYDTKGLVTSGTAATTADIAASTDKNYVTDAQLAVIGSTSGTNTGDETVTTIKEKLGITILSGSNTGDQNLTSVLTQGSDAGNKKIMNVNQQGIGTSTPDASSALEISSTTQGFLPPRMSQAQRNVITPVEGLIVYNTTTKKPNYYDGTEWKNYDGTNAYLVGDSYRGGIVAYILQPGDPGWIPGETHGLIAAPSDQSTGAEWGCYGTFIEHPEGTEIGTGNQNTIDIVTGCTTAGIAAKLCYDLTLNGYSDWYLPSQDELNKLYLNRVSIGGFANDVYWSSSQVTDLWAIGQNFNLGYDLTYDKFNSYYVRAIRAF